MTTSSTRVVVIGAGQAGLAVAYYLRKLMLEPGRDFVVFDRGPITGGAWQHRWDALRLGSTHRVSDLPAMDKLGLSFETADRTLPARDIVAGYYRRYEEHFGLDVRRPVTVTRVADDGPDLVVTHSEGQTRTDLVVNATGTWGSPFVPYYPGMRRFAGRHIHTSTYRSAEELAGLSVVVVGGGTSAAGFLLELEGVASDLTWVARREIDFSDQPVADIEGGVASTRVQDAAARSGQALPSIVSGTGIPLTRRIAAGISRGILVSRAMFVEIEEGGVRFADGSFVAADAIIWATGFRPELRHLSPLLLREKAGGVTVETGASWVDARIFFAGYGPHASTVGANRSGRIIARQVVARL